MAYGFNEDRSKTPVYTKAEIDAMDLADNQALQQEIADRQAAVSQEANARQAGDSSLDARISNIIAQGQSTEGNTELIDIRTGADDIIYSLAGDAVRKQFVNSNNRFEYFSKTGNLFFNTKGFVSGILSGQTGQVITGSGNRYRIVSPFIIFDKDITLTVIDSNFRCYIAYYDDESTIVSSNPGWKNAWTIPANQLFRIQIARTSESSSEVADIGLFITKVSYGSEFKNIITDNLESQPAVQHTYNILDKISQEAAQADGTTTSSTVRVMQSKRFGGLDYDAELYVEPNGQDYSYMIYDSLYTSNYHYRQATWLTAPSVVTLPAGKYIQFTMSKHPATENIPMVPSENLVEVFCDRHTADEMAVSKLGDVIDIYNYESIIKKSILPEMSFNSTLANYTHNPQRSAVVTPIMFPFDITVECDSDTYKFSLQYFNGNVADVNHYETATGWLSKQTIPANQWFCMIVAYRNDSNVDNDLVNGFSISSPVDILTIVDDIKDINEAIGGIDYTNYSIGPDLVRRRLAVTEVGLLSQQQSFCIYNGHYFSTNGSWITEQDENFQVARSVQLAVGHGNSFQLGNSNIAYVSGWDDQKVYAVNLDTLEVVNTITLPTTGYTTAVVDDVRKLAYIFQRDTYPLTYETYNFIVFDYENNQIVKQSTLTERFSALQGMDLYQDKIIAVNGLGSNVSSTYPDYKNGYRVYDLDGRILSSWHLGSNEEVEPEGICINRLTGETFFMDASAKLFKIS